MFTNECVVTETAEGHGDDKLTVTDRNSSGRTARFLVCGFLVSPKLWVAALWSQVEQSFFILSLVIPGYTNIGCNDAI